MSPCPGVTATVLSCHKLSMDSPSKLNPRHGWANHVCESLDFGIQNWIRSWNDTTVKPHQSPSARPSSLCPISSWMSHGCPIGMSHWDVLTPKYLKKLPSTQQISGSQRANQRLRFRWSTAGTSHPPASVSWPKRLGIATPCNALSSWKEGWYISPINMGISWGDDGEMMCVASCFLIKQLHYRTPRMGRLSLDIL